MSTDKQTKRPHENTPPNQQDEAVIAAHDEAEKDIEDDGELSLKPEPTDDLDEGELARFEAEGNTTKEQ